MTGENWSTLILDLAGLLIAGSGGGFIIALRKDKRQEDKEDVAILDLIREVAGKTVEDIREELGRRSKEWVAERIELNRKIREANQALIEEREDRIKQGQDLARKLEIAQAGLRHEHQAALEAIHWALAHRLWIRANVETEINIPPSELLKQYMGELSSKDLGEDL